jgi:FMN-dependent NADH-azoreductase
MIILRIDSSIRREGSVSRELTDAAQRAWLDTEPAAEVVGHDFGARPLPAETGPLAAAAGSLPRHRRTPAMRAARATATRLADEALAAGAMVIGAPMYNFGIPAALKSWIDVLITDPRFDPRHTPVGSALRGVPVALLVACGGGYGPGTPRAGWDHATPYLRRIFADVFGAALTVVVAELTALPDPALRSLAERSRAAALDRAGRVADRTGGGR